MKWHVKTDVLAVQKRGSRQTALNAQASQSIVKAGKTTMDIFVVKNSCNLIKQAYIIVAMLATSFLGAGQDFRVLSPTESKPRATALLRHHFTPQRNELMTNFLHKTDSAFASVSPGVDQRVVAGVLVAAMMYKTGEGLPPACLVSRLFPVNTLYHHSPQAFPCIKPALKHIVSVDLPATHPLYVRGVSADVKLDPPSTDMLVPNASGSPTRLAKCRGRTRITRAKV
jgi:hypothetical protein